LTKITKHLYTAFRIILAVGMLYYLARSGLIEWSALSGLVSSWHYTLLAIVLFFVATFLQAWRLQILINTHLNLSFYASVRLTFIGLFFNTYLPGATGGDLVKIYYASKGNPGSKTEVVTIFFIDRFIGLFSLLSLPLLMAPFFWNLIEQQSTLKGLLIISLAVSTGIILVVTLGARFDADNSRFLGFIERKIPFGDIFRRAINTMHAYRYQKKIIFKAIGCSLFLQLIMVYVSLSIAQAINKDGASLEMTILVPLGYLANALPVTPGGIGVGEAAMESLFALFQLPGGAEMMIGWRIVMVIAGLAGLAFYLKGEKRMVFSKG